MVVARRCVLRCQLYGSAKCDRCGIPDETGRALCPRCHKPVFFLAVKDGKGLWGCSNPPGRGCGATISVPVGSVETAAVAEAELVELRREKARQRQVISRARNRARKPVPEAVAA